MKKIFFLLFLSLQLNAQEYAIKKGVVADSLKVSDTLNESFSVYLPSYFDSNRKWPVLYIFDEEGRGKSAAQLFKTAAEEQGYILISSNDIAKEAPMLENVKTATRLLQSTYRNFPIDVSQISVAGSGEGARVASSLPFILNDIFGVLAVGNHWINFDFVDKRKEFAFIGVVGDEQYTSKGMKMTAKALEHFRFPSEVYTYEGDKEWPGADVISAAVGSLTLEAMRKKLRPYDMELVNSLYRQDLNKVNKFMSTGQLLLADSFLELMEDKYENLKQMPEVEARREQLEDSRNFVRQKRLEEDIAEKESRLLDDFIYYLQEDIRTANFENLGWWNYQKRELDSLSQKGGVEAKMAERLKGYISELTLQKRREMEKKKARLEPLLLANMLQTIYNPQDYEAYKNIISLSAQDNDFSTALFYLEEMLKHGYDNKEALYNIEGTLGLKLTEEYNKLIEKYLGSAKYYSEE